MQQEKDSTSQIMESLANAAPLISFIVSCGAFALVGIFKADYYGAIFADRWASWGLGIGIFAAVITEAARAALLLLTFSDFRSGKIFGGLLGLVLSAGLVLYDCASAGPISTLWNDTHTATIGIVIRDVVVFLVALSGGIELRLALSAKFDTKPDNSKANKPDIRTPTATFMPNNSERAPAENGSTKLFNSEQKIEQDPERRQMGFRMQNNSAERPDSVRANDNRTIQPNAEQAKSNTENRTQPNRTGRPNTKKSNAIRKAEQLRSDGASYDEISEQVGYAKSTVYGWLN